MAIGDIGQSDGAYKPFPRSPVLLFFCIALLALTVTSCSKSVFDHSFCLTSLLQENTARISQVPRNHASYPLPLPPHRRPRTRPRLPRNLVPDPAQQSRLWQSARILTPKNVRERFLRRHDCQKAIQTPSAETLPQSHR